jgi:transmembrane sensor
MVTIDKNLLLKYLDGTLNEEEATSLYNWAQESPENKEYLLSMKEASMFSRYNAPMKKADTRTEWYKFLEKAGLKEKHPYMLRAFINLAAAIILVAGGIFFLKEKDKVGNTAYDQDTPLLIETGIGQTAGATLPDGSIIKLNSCSRLSYNPARWRKERSVILWGEASFDVAHEETRPFSVKTARYKISVLGTRFDINSYPGSEKDFVSLKSGKVTVDIMDNSDQTLELTPGNSFVFDNGSGKYEIKPTDKNQFSWENGEIVFDNQTLVQKRAEIYRLYGYTLQISKGCSIMSYRATFNGESINEIMAVLAKITPNLAYRIDDENKTVTIWKK